MKSLVLFFLLFPASAFSMPIHAPPEYRTLVQVAADITGMDARLLAAVIAVESNFQPLAVSRRGAQGLMQLMPEVQQMMGLRRPFDAMANVLAGSRYLKSLLRRYHSVELALAAYNAGPSAVDKSGGVPPLKETQAFVRKVLGLIHK